MKKSACIALQCAVALVAFAIVSWADYEDAVQDEIDYCVKVSDGTWPDFRKEEDGEDYLSKCFKK